MIDLTPLDVRNKRSDFKKILRGYDPQEVNTFLEMVAERMETLVRENIQMRERAENLQQQVSSSTGREHAVQEALVTAQELRADIRDQAQREAELIIQEAQAEARRRVTESERRIEELNDSLVELERRRLRFLKAFRQLLERELDGVQVEESHAPLEERSIELHLGGGRPEGADAGVGDGVGDGEVGDAVATDGIDDTGSAAPDRRHPSEAVVWDTPVHELAREHADEATAAPEGRREGDLFSLPELPPRDGRDQSGR